MDDSRLDTVLRWSWTLFLLVVTVGWAVFCVKITLGAVESKLATDIIAASGASVVLGVLLAMLKDCNQFFFRKAKGAS